MTSEDEELPIGIRSTFTGGSLLSLAHKAIQRSMSVDSSYVVSDSEDIPFKSAAPFMSSVDSSEASLPGHSPTRETASAQYLHALADEGDLTKSYRSTAVDLDVITRPTSPSSPARQPYYFQSAEVIRLTSRVMALESENAELVARHMRFDKLQAGWETMLHDLRASSRSVLEKNAEIAVELSAKSAALLRANQRNADLEADVATLKAVNERLVNAAAASKDKTREAAAESAGVAATCAKCVELKCSLLLSERMAEKLAIEATSASAKLLAERRARVKDSHRDEDRVYEQIEGALALVSGYSAESSSERRTGVLRRLSKLETLTEGKVKSLTQKCAKLQELNLNLQAALETAVSVKEYRELQLRESALYAALRKAQPAIAANIHGLASGSKIPTASPASQAMRRDKALRGVVPTTLLSLLEQSATASESDAKGDYPIDGHRRTSDIAFACTLVVQEACDVLGIRDAASLPQAIIALHKASLTVPELEAFCHAASNLVQRAWGVFAQVDSDPIAAEATHVPVRPNSDVNLSLSRLRHLLGDYKILKQLSSQPVQALHKLLLELTKLVESDTVSGVIPKLQSLHTYIREASLFSSRLKKMFGLSALTPLASLERCIGSYVSSIGLAPRTWICENCHRTVDQAKELRRIAVATARPEDESD